MQHSERNLPRTLSVVTAVILLMTCAISFASTDFLELIRKGEQPGEAAVEEVTAEDQELSRDEKTSRAVQKDPADTEILTLSERLQIFTRSINSWLHELRSSSLFKAMLSPFTLLKQQQKTVGHQIKKLRRSLSGRKKDQRRGRIRPLFPPRRRRPDTPDIPDDVPDIPEEPDKPDTPTVRTGIVTAPVGLNVRSGPGIDNSCITALHGGTRVVVLEEGTDPDGQTWYRVRFPGGEGWVSGKYLDVQDGRTDEPPAPDDPGQPPFTGQNATRWTEAEKQEIISRAEAISQRCRENPGTNPTEEELHLLVEAVEIQTGVPSQLLKVLIFGESIATAYTDRVPRQFVDPKMGPGIADRATWARDLLGVDLPVLIGDDREFNSNTFGLGISQVTSDIDRIKRALAGENNGMARVLGGGSPGTWWKGDTVEMDVRQAMTDPYYNIMVLARLIQHKHGIYTDPDRPQGPISWMPRNPQTPEDWALIASTVSTYGGYGPGGGATKRILDRMTDPEADAYQFANIEPTL